MKIESRFLSIVYFPLPFSSFSFDSSDIRRKNLVLLNPKIGILSKIFQSQSLSSLWKALHCWVCWKRCTRIMSGFLGNFTTFRIILGEILLCSADTWSIFYLAIARDSFSATRFIYIKVKLGIQTPEDWYKLKTSDLHENYGGTLVLLYKNDIFKLLSTIYPELTLHPWGFMVKGDWTKELNKPFLEYLYFIVQSYEGT